LGFDVTQSIFEVGVNQRLEEIAAVIASAEPAAIATLLRTQSEVFQGLAESLNLPGFGAIAQAATRALDEHPDQVILIAQTALADFQTGQEAVLNGDRTQGGQPSALLQQLSGLQPSTQTEIEALEAPGEELTLTSDWTESVSDLVDYPGVEVEVYSETSLASNLEPPDFSEFESFSLFDTVPEVPLEVEESDTFQTPTWTSQPEVHSHSSAYDSELNLDESPEEESANLLLESIWGETGETDTEREQGNTPRSR
jgi:hypothetical protein